VGVPPKSVASWIRHFPWGEKISTISFPPVSTSCSVFPLRVTIRLTSEVCGATSLPFQSEPTT
jgi:hypothetical protein